MAHKILIATHNLHKRKEIKQILGSDYEVQSLTDFKIYDEIIENGTSFEANAEIKAKYCYEKTRIPSIGDDSGLVVEALDGRPGIYSARYGSDHDFAKNIEKVLSEMKDKENRKAYFITIMCYYDTHGAHFFEGRIYGTLLMENKGHKGFGYDPIFVPKGYTKTFAEMKIEEKNAISHRKIALEKLLNFMK